MKDIVNAIETGQWRQHVTGQFAARRRREMARFVVPGELDLCTVVYLTRVMLPGRIDRRNGDLKPSAYRELEGLGWVKVWRDGRYRLEREHESN